MFQLAIESVSDFLLATMRMVWKTRALGHLGVIHQEKGREEAKLWYANGAADDGAVAFGYLLSEEGGSDLSWDRHMLELLVTSSRQGALSDLWNDFEECFR